MRILPLVLVCAISMAAQAQSGPQGRPSDLITVLPHIQELASMPDASVVRDADGLIRSVELNRSGVVIRASRENGHVEVVGRDTTTAGVMCVWEMTLMFRLALSVCGSPTHEELRQVLDDGLSAINAFIIANSLVPVTTESITQAIAQFEQQGRNVSANAPQSQVTQRCRQYLAESGILEPTFNRLLFFREFYGRLLSVPRPPVLFPCL